MIELDAPPAGPRLATAGGGRVNTGNATKSRSAVPFARSTARYAATRPPAPPPSSGGITSSARPSQVRSPAETYTPPVDAASNGWTRNSSAPVTPSNTTTSVGTPGPVPAATPDPPAASYPAHETVNLVAVVFAGSGLTALG